MKHVLVFTMDGCPHCTDFKEMLTNEGIEYAWSKRYHAKARYTVLVMVVLAATVMVILFCRSITFLHKDKVP